MAGHKIRMLILGACFSAAACGFDSTVPAGKKVQCRVDTDCRPGYACQLSTGLCALKNDIDPEAPTISLASFVVTLTPGPDNPLLSPTALTYGTTANIVFSTSEALKGLPELVLTPALSCSGVSSSGDVRFELSCQLPTPGPGVPVPADGPVGIAVTMRDSKENPGRFESSDFGLRIDVTPPPAPSTNTEGAVLYVREPWGSEDAGSSARFSVTGQSGSTSAASWVLVLADGRERGRTQVASSGAFGPLKLPAVDAPTLDLVAVDSAGNRSALARVRDIEWVATLGGKVAGSTTENPHRFDTVTVFSSALERRDSQEQGALDGLGQADGLATRTVGAASWEQRAFPALYGNQGRAAMVYDSRRSRIVRMGAQEFFGVIPLIETTVVEWNGSDWANISATDPEGDGTPAGLPDTTFAYDETVGRTLAVGTQAPTASGFAQVWYWNGVSWRAGPQGPSHRQRGSLVYDVSREQFVYFGGRNFQSTEAYGDTWVLKNDVWTRRDIPGPAPRFGAGFVYERKTGTALLFGGKSPDAGSLGDTWRFNGEAWTQLSDGSDGGPQPRSLMGMAHDTERDRTYLFSGSDEAGEPLGDVWVFSGQSWAPVAATGGPGARNDSSAVYDSARDEIIVVGGGSKGPFALAKSETWAFRTSDLRWVRRSAVSVSPPLGAPDAITYVDTFETVARTVRLGAGILIDPHRTQTLVLGDDGWRPLGVSPEPPPLATQSLSYDARTATLYWFGHNPLAPVEVYRLDATNIGAGWVRVDNSSGLTVLPSGATPIVSGVGFLVPANAFATLAFDGMAWTAGPSLVTEAASGRLTQLPDGGAFAAGLYGGSEFPVSLQQLVGGAFVSRPSPPSGTELALAWDSRRESLISVGGFLFSNLASSSTFEFSAGIWKKLEVADPDQDGAPSLGSSLATYDPRREAVVLVGGKPRANSTMNANRGTWYLRVAPYRPGAVARMTLAPAQLPPGWTPRQVTFKALVGATGRLRSNNAFGQIDGAGLYVWEKSKWQLKGVNGAASTGSFAPVSVTLSDAASLKELFAGHHDLSMALAPLGTNGDSFAQLAVDYVETRLRYRLPEVTP